MTKKTQNDALLAEAERLSQKYGPKSGALGSQHFHLDVVPTGSLALDYAMGTGGWPLGHPCEVYGAPDIGKSSVLGLSAFRHAQAKGLTTGLIALEPSFDPEWAKKNGVDPDRLIVARPNDGEEAFTILHEWVCGDIVDFILFDSIGAVVAPSEAAEGGTARMGGASGLITWGIRRILTPTWKNNKGLIFLNQVRDNLKSPIPGQVQSPGGHAMKHGCDIRVYLRQASGTTSIYKEKIEGDDVVVGKKLLAQVMRNKMSEGTNIKATFDYYQRDTEDHPVGIDQTDDILATGMRTGIIRRAGAYYRHPAFPGDNHQVQGRDGVEEVFAKNPKVVSLVRQDVLKVMLRKAGPIKQGGPDLDEYDEGVADGN